MVNPPPPPESGPAIAPHWHPDAHGGSIANVDAGSFWLLFFIVGALAVAIGVFAGLYVYTWFVAHSLSSALTGQ